MMMHICFTSYIVQSEFYTFRYFDTMMFLLLTVTYRVLFFQWLSLALFSSYLNITILRSVCPSCHLSVNSMKAYFFTSDAIWIACLAYYVYYVFLLK